MWWRWLDYLRWLPGTVHLHGIHSPFIFRLKKEVFKASAKRNSPDIAFAKASQTKVKSEKLDFEKLKTFRRIAGFFEVEKILVLGKNTEAVAFAFNFERNVSVTQSETIASKTTETFDLIYIKLSNFSKSFPLEELLEKITENTCWLLDRKNTSAATREIFAALKNHQSVKQTIDCHWFGLILFREAQPKEDFKIYP